MCPCLCTTRQLRKKPVELLEGSVHTSGAKFNIPQALTDVKEFSTLHSNCSMRDGYYNISTFRLATAIAGVMSIRYTRPASLPLAIIECKSLFVNPCVALMNIFS